MNERTTVDFNVKRSGTNMFVLFARSEAGKEWVGEHIDLSWAMEIPGHDNRNATPVDIRYLGDILNGIEADGLTVGVI
jgi:hypothetical protein